TATTNTAVAQFSDTLLRLTDLNVLRFVSDSSLAEGVPTTPVDLHTILKQLSTKFHDVLEPYELDECSAYAQGRELIEDMIFHPERTINLSDEERDRYRIAEREISEATEDAVEIMFRVRRPAIICMTTAGLLNATDRGGIFKGRLTGCRVVIGDEASQIPEPAFVAIAARFPDARHIYIGDVNQLDPHVRCSRNSKAAQLGARGIMDILLRKNVPLAPLLTTFRAHPALNELPSQLFYDGTLISGTAPDERRLLLDAINLPNPDIPFLFVDVAGESIRSTNGSHFNEAELQACRDLVQGLLAKGLPSASLSVIAFYREQYRKLEDYAQRLNIAIYTVDSVQGRETDIVILLTTRTDIQLNQGDFIDDRLRMNVALTRSKHGLFVLGKAKALEHLPHWSRLLQWADNHGVIATTTTLADLLL
ncbi:hypothetical protein OESDEN_22896, partial [Oesophagostomum dentatum]